MTAGNKVFAKLPFSVHRFVLFVPYHFILAINSRINSDAVISFFAAITFNRWYSSEVQRTLICLSFGRFILPVVYIGYTKLLSYMGVLPHILIETESLFVVGAGIAYL